MTTDPSTITVAWFGPGPRDRTGRLVCWATRSPYCHVGVAAGGRFYEALAPVVVSSPAAGRLAAAAATKTLPVTPEALGAIVAHAERAAGHEPYDYLGFVNLAVRLVAARAGLAVPLVLGERDAVVCSAFAATLLALGDYDCGDARELTPADLAAYFGAGG